MEKLTVYTDMLQTLKLLRAAKNRVLNGMLTSPRIDNKQDVARCEQLVNLLYRTQLRKLTHVVELLASAVQSKDFNKTLIATGLLHKSNRQTAKLTRIFEEDIIDTHPSIADDDDDASSITLKKFSVDQVNAVTISVSRFRTILESELAAAAGTPVKVK